MKSIADSLIHVRIQYPGDDSRLSRMSLIDEAGPKYVRMANLACVGSYAVNGVAELHTDLLKRELFFQILSNCGQTNSTT